jgi:hypothetical protein
MHFSIVSFGRFICCFLLAFFVFDTAHSAALISGTATAKEGEVVKVEFKPHKTVGPQKGDKVDFKTMMEGIEINAGQGKVTESKGNYAWVKIIKGRPRLKMTGIIHATGKPGPVEYVLDIEHFKFQHKQKWYRAGGAKLKMELQSGLKFKAQGQGYSARLPDKTLIQVESVNQGWEATPLAVHHQSGREVAFSNSSINKCTTVWQDRTINVSSATCIASRAQCMETMSGETKHYFYFYSSCRAKNFPRKNGLVENYYTINFNDRFSFSKGTPPDQMEKSFLNALQSFSVEIKE